MHQVMRSDELQAGTSTEPELVAVELGGRDVLLCRTEEGHVIAFCATCPHQETSLEQATFFEGRLRCARHLYLYDTTTGENIVPAHDARPEILWKLKPSYLPVYAVEERDGWIWVDDQPKAPPAAYDPAREQKPADGGLAVELPPALPDLLDVMPQSHRVKVGQVLDLVIDFDPAPSHIWRLEIPGDALVIDGERFTPEPSPQHHFALRASVAGQVIVTGTYGAPWGGSPKETRTFVVTVLD